MHIRFLATILITLSFLMSPAVHAQAGQQSTAPERKQAGESGWLGIWVEPLPPVLRAQFAPLIAFDEGLLVSHVEQSSPAEAAGVRQYDVLMSIGGQRLYSPRQLSSLVQNFNADSQVELVVIQQGQLKTLDTTLSAKRTRTLARTRRPPRPYFPYRGFTPPPPPAPAMANDPDAWDMFETIEVKTLPDGRYRAVVSFKDNHDETKTFTFEGEKKEILRQIQQLDSLPAAKKRALLKALNLRPGNMSGFASIDELKRDLFTSPLFGHSPFDHPLLDDPLIQRPFFSAPWNRPPRYPPWQFHLYPDYPGQIRRP